MTQTLSIESQLVLQRVYREFFSPGNYKIKSADEAILAYGNNYRIPYVGGDLAVTTWGEFGPSVLLMHGWGGARGQMTGFVDPLLKAGYCVVAYDQPAYGESNGETTNILEIVPTMDFMLRKEDSFDAIIAHSFGTLITSYALVNRNFPPPTKLIYFSAFNRLMDSLERFQVLTELPDEVIEGLRTMLIANFGPGVLEAITNEGLTPQINIPTLMFHDKSDNVTPIEDSRAIAWVWKYAHLVETDMLGHRGALRSESIYKQVLRFLAN